MKTLGMAAALAAALAAIGCSSNKGGTPTGSGGSTGTAGASSTSSGSPTSSGTGGTASSSSGSPTSSGTGAGSTSSSGTTTSTSSTSTSSSSGSVVPCSAHVLGFGPADVKVTPAPTAVVRADFNGDGIEDLADLENGTVTVLLGFGDGTFATPQSYTLSLAPSGASNQLIVAADFDGDGHPDVAVAESSGQVQILAGSSSGTLTAQTPISLNGFPTAAGLVAGDFDGDGKPDLAVFEGSTGQIAVLTNQGSFSFKESDPSLLSGTPSALAAVDVNADGRLDLLAVIGSSKQLAVILNKASGFSPVTPVSLPATPQTLAAADLNGDQKPDVVVGCTDGSVQILLGNGAGGFGAPTSMPGSLAGTLEQVGVGDVDGDGHPDIVALASSSLAVWPSTGAGTWGGAAYFLPGGNGMAVGDLNGDGKADVAVGTSQTYQVSVLLAAPVTLLAAPTLAQSTKTFGAAILADVNGDGHLDAVAVSTATDEVGVFLNKGDGSLAPVVTYGVGTGAQPSTVAVGDFNGDGRLDLAVSSPGLGKISVLLGTANGFGPVKQVTAVNTYGVLVADFNNDGKADLLGYGGSGISVLPGTGTGAFGSEIAQTNVPDSIYALAVAKVNKDQTLDLVGVSSPFASFDYVANAFTLLGNGDGTFGGGSTYSLGGGLGGNPVTAALVAAGDFDGDGNTDVAVYETSYNSYPTLDFLAGDGTGTLTYKAYGGGGTVSGIAAGDFDGDGKLDLAVAHTDTPGIGVLAGDGAWHFTEAFFRTASLPLQSLAAGDLAGDGRPSLFFGVSPGAGEVLNLCK